MYYISESDCEKFKRSNELFSRLSEVQARHVQVHERFHNKQVTEDEVIAIDEELSVALGEWRKSLVVMKKID